MERVLVIEDDVQIQNFMIYALENSGFEVEGALNGKDGLSSFIMKGALNTVRSRITRYRRHGYS